MFLSQIKGNLGIYGPRLQPMYKPKLIPEIMPNICFLVSSIDIYFSLLSIFNNVHGEFSYIFNSLIIHSLVKWFSFQSTVAPICCLTPTKKQTQCLGCLMTIHVKINKLKNKLLVYKRIPQNVHLNSDHVPYFLNYGQLKFQFSHTTKIVVQHYIYYQ